jgi:hypothetical protein
VARRNPVLLVLGAEQADHGSTETFLRGVPMQ